MAATTAVKAGIISAATGLVLVVGAIAVSSTVAGAQTPTPDTQQQQTTPTTPGTPGTRQAPNGQTAPDGTHDNADCPGMDGSGTGGQGMGRGPRGAAPNDGTAPQDGGTSSGSSYSGSRGGPRF